MRKILSLLVVLLTTFTSAWADNNYLCFTAEEANSSVTFNWKSGSDVQISTDGTNFNVYTAGTAIPLAKVGDKVYFKGTGVKTYDNKHFEMSGKIAASGDITSLTNGTGGDATLTSECCRGMFWDCTSLTTAPNLPSTTLGDYCYRNMFYGCTSLTTAPELPATTLKQFCYNAMFWGCTSLTTAPNLPATKLESRVYNLMFNGCTSLTTAPNLPATTLTYYCYSGMFRGCTSLTTAPELPATTLAESCYNTMFSGCTSLTTAPELPATTLQEYCYQYMFDGCTSLTTAPELPATILVKNCYRSMFFDCTLLTTAPQLPATTLAEKCYCEMFRGCSKLNKVTVNFTDWGTSLVDEGAYPTTDWLKDAGTDASVTSRTFICSVGLTLPATRSDSDVPEAWTVVKSVSTEADLNTAVSNITAGEVIQLTADIDLTAELNVASGKDFTLDLNGHKIDAQQRCGVITSKGTLTVKNGTITGGKSADAGGGIFNHAGATLTLKDVTISNCTAQSGGAIENEGTCTVENGTITGNSANYGYGGGIYNTGTLNLIGTSQCTITGNTSTASSPAGGINASGWGLVSIKGKVIIKDNTTDGKAANLCLINLSSLASKITIDEAGIAGSEIGVTTMDEQGTVGAYQFTTNGSADDAQYFFSDDDKYVLQYNTNHLELARLVTLNETDATYPEAGVWDENQIYNITLNRTLSASKWNTLMLPFPMTADEVTANFGADAKVMKMTGVTNYVVNFETATAIDACEPYIVQPAADAKIEVKGKTGLKSSITEGSYYMYLTAGEVKAYKMCDSWQAASYFNATTITAPTSTPSYVLSDNKFYLVKTNVPVNGYRWHFSESGGAEAKPSLAISFDGTVVTGIENVNANASTGSAQANGKYLKNGKFVIVKDGKTFNAAGQEVK